MKKLLLFLFIAVSALSYSQDNWQRYIAEKNINFFEIKADFEIYYQNHVSNPRLLPKGKGIKQFKRWEYYWESRVDENGNFPVDGYILQEINRYNNQNVAQRYASGNGTWEIVGPVSLPNNGTGQLNGNGRINCIAFHPSDANTIFAGAPSGGFWKSTDGGTTWTDYLNGLVRLGISSIVVHPSNPNTIFIGTGDRDGGDAPGYGVWRSTDGGVTWASHNSGMGNRTINEIIIDPSNPNNMLAASSNQRIYRTTNGGTTWSSSASLGTNPKDIAYHPTNPNIVYASGTSFHKSTDGGVTWVQIINGVPSSVQRIAMAVSIDEPNWVYLLAGDGNGLVGVYRSTDSGSTFSTRATSPNILGWNTDGSGAGSQAWYDLVIAADPTDANTIYTGGVNLWKSTDGGLNMSCISYWVGATGGIDGVHADQHALEFSPLTNTLYNGNDGGVYYTTDSGINWNDISSGLAIAQIYKIGVSQQSSEVVINGYQDNGTAISNGSTFTTEIGGDGMECIIDPTDDNYVYGSLYYGDIRRSTDGGSTFSGSITGSITENSGWVTPYKLDPNDANRMFAGFDNIWRNDAVRSGNTWTQISSFGGTQNIRDLAIAPSNSNIMYVSRYDNSFRRTNNALAANPTWTNLTANLPASNEPKDIEIDPSDPTHLFIALNNDIYESNDSGNSWTNISGTLPNLSLNTIVIDATSPVDAMYVGMDVGVYYIDNNLTDWVSYSDGLANLEITELEIQYSPDCKNKLYAATYGQGLWKSDLKDPGNVAPIACFEASSTSGCVGNEFILSDNSDYSPTSWSWTISPTTFVFNNGTNANSQNPEISFTTAGTYTISLTVTNAYGSDTLTKNAYITVANGSIASSFNEDFESETLCGTGSDCGATVCGLSSLWTNLTNGSDDDIDWRIDEGGTPSTGTGPTVDSNPGTSTGNYAYLEASNGCSGQIAILESQCMLLDQEYDFILGYHMLGVDMGSLHIDIFNQGVWQESVMSASGDLGNSWNDMTVDLSAYVGQSIKIRVRGITGSWWASDMAIDDLRLSPKCALTTWNGSSWNNGIPTLSLRVEISGNYDTAIHGSFESCSLLVNSGNELIINDSDFIVIENALTNNGIVTIKNNGSLVQINDISTNIGVISFERIASIRKLDYVYWSSPIEGFDVSTISPLTPSGFIYKWDSTFTNPNGGEGYWINASGEIMTPGKGYIVRGPDNFTTSAQDYTAIFNNGKPNNGIISIPISRGTYTGVDYPGNNGATITNFDDNWNLVGNPYPSAISALDFLNLNSSLIEGAVRIWTHGTLPSSSNGDSFYDDFETSYSASDYIVHNGTGTVSGPTGFNGFIAGGQGFMVLMNDGNSLTDNLLFNNSLRNKSHTNNQFYRSSNPLELDRLWLDLSNEDAISDRTLIGYIEGATNIKDRLYDAVTNVDLGTHKIYSFSEGVKLAIQGLAPPFEVEDQIPIGVNIPSTGMYTFSIYTLEGIFNNQSILIEDTLLGSITNISEIPYTFYAEPEEINNRFILRFDAPALSINDLEYNVNILLYNDENTLYIKSQNELIKDVIVYDILGRKLIDKYSIYNQNYNINSLSKSDSILLFKIVLNNDKIVYRKIIF